jgi:hypothetical protein
MIRSIDEHTQGSQSTVSCLTSDVYAQIREIVNKYQGDKLAIQTALSPEKFSQIQLALDEAVLRSEEKVKVCSIVSIKLRDQLAQETYDIVDKHIRRLDDDLRKFNEELQQEQLHQKTQAEQVQCNSLLY